MPTPTATNITNNGADLSCPAFTDLSGPITYQWIRIEGTEDFVPSPLVITPQDGDGVFSPATLTFVANGELAPVAQGATITPPTIGTKTINAISDGGLNNLTPVTYDSHLPFEPVVPAAVVTYYGYEFFNDGATPVKGRRIQINLVSEVAIVIGHAYLEQNTRIVETDETGLWQVTLARGEVYTISCPESKLFKTVTAVTDLSQRFIDIDSVL